MLLDGAIFEDDPAQSEAEDRQRRVHQREESTMKALLPGLFLLGGLLAASPAISEGSPPATEQAKKIEALVNKAAALIDKNGKAAFAEFRKKDSEWWFGTTYLFAYDIDLNVLLNPAFPKREGTNPRGEKDANGKALHDEFLKVVQTKGSGWVDYVFPKPGQTETSQKWSYVKAMTVDGKPGIVGAGFYPE